MQLYRGAKGSDIWSMGHSSGSSGAKQINQKGKRQKEDYQGVKLEHLPLADLGKKSIRLFFL